MKNICSLIMLCTIVQQSSAMWPVHSGPTVEQVKHASKGRRLFSQRRVAKHGVPTETPGIYKLRRPMPFQKNLDHVYSTLHDAVKADDLEGIKKFITDGADINGFNADGDRPLHCAIDQRCCNAIEFLVQEDADISLYDRSHVWQIQDLVWMVAENDRDHEPAKALKNGLEKLKLKLKARLEAHNQPQLCKQCEKDEPVILIQLEPLKEVFQKYAEEEPEKEAMVRRSERIKEILKQKK